MGHNGGVDYGLFGSPKPNEPGYEEYVRARTPPPEAATSGPDVESYGSSRGSPAWTDDKAAKRFALLGAAVGLIWGCVVASENDRVFLAGLFALLGAVAGWMVGLFWKLIVTLAVIAGAIYIWASVDKSPEGTKPPDMVFRSSP